MYFNSKNIFQVIILFPWLVSKRNSFTLRGCASPTGSEMNDLAIKNAGKRFKIQRSAKLVCRIK